MIGSLDSEPRRLYEDKPLRQPVTSAFVLNLLLCDADLAGSQKVFEFFRFESV